MAFGRLWKRVISYDSYNHRASGAAESTPCAVCALCFIVAAVLTFLGGCFPSSTRRQSLRRRAHCCLGSTPCLPYLLFTILRSHLRSLRHDTCTLHVADALPSARLVFVLVVALDAVSPSCPPSFLFLLPSLSLPFSPSSALPPARRRPHRAGARPHARARRADQAGVRQVRRVERDQEHVRVRRRA
jgi:hypothetical protein